MLPPFQSPSVTWTQPAAALPQAPSPLKPLQPVPRTRGPLCDICGQVNCCGEAHCPQAVWSPVLCKDWWVAAQPILSLAQCPALTRRCCDNSFLHVPRWWLHIHATPNSSTRPAVTEHHRLQLQQEHFPLGGPEAAARDSLPAQRLQGGKCIAHLQAASVLSDAGTHAIRSVA